MAVALHLRSGPCFSCGDRQCNGRDFDSMRHCTMELLCEVLHEALSCSCGRQVAELWTLGIHAVGMVK